MKGHFADQFIGTSSTNVEVNLKLDPDYSTLDCGSKTLAKLQVDDDENADCTSEMCKLFVMQI